ncbi:MAG: MFS transporter [Synechococcales cyanobacterium M58_A2018_015]|nr:MFS transporter [Synechococcales cyanobacterium M58_A2018_015]
MTQTHNRLKLWVLLAAGSLAVMPGAVIIPVLGEIEQQFQLDKALAQAGWLASAHYSTVALFSPILGLVANRMGWVRVLVGSLLLFAVFGIAGAWTTSYEAMLVTRLLLGAATGGIAAASLGILAQLYRQEEERSQAIALASSTISLANIAYPLLAGLVGATNWRWAFYLYGMSLPIALAAALTLADRSNSERPASASLLKGVAANKIGTLARDSRVLRFLVTLLLTSATAYATVTTMPIYLKEAINASTPTIGAILASQAIGSAAIAAFGLKYLTRRLGTVLCIGIGFGSMAVALVAIPNVLQASLLMLVAILFGIGLGIVMPSHYGALANVTPPALQSIVLALGTGVTFLGQFLSPGLYTFLLQSLPEAASAQTTTVFYVAAVLVLSMGFLLVATFRSLIQTELSSRLRRQARNEP